MMTEKPQWFVWQFREGLREPTPYYYEESANIAAKELAEKNDSPAIVAKTVRTFVRQIIEVQEDSK